MWKKVHDSGDNIRFEKKERGLLIMIEARMKEDGSWDIFTKYSGKDLEHIESAHTKNRADTLICIQAIKEEALGLSELKSLQDKMLRTISVKLKRKFKDYSVEKWEFSVDEEDFKNVVYILFEDSICMDIVMDQKYEVWADQIITQLLGIFNLDNSEISLKVNLYYYSKYKNSEKKSTKAELVGMLEMDLGFS